MENTNLNEEIVIETAEDVVDCAEEIVVDELPEDIFEENADAEETPSQKLARKCQEAKAACMGTIDRIARDLKETNYNPYFKQTRTYKLEIYRNCNDEEPIDVYETVDTKSFSARAFAVATVAAAALVVATNGVVKKILK